MSQLTHGCAVDQRQNQHDCIPLASGHRRDAQVLLVTPPVASGLLGGGIKIRAI